MVSRYNSGNSTTYKLDARQFENHLFRMTSEINEPQSCLNSNVYQHAALIVAIANTPDGTKKYWFYGIPAEKHCKWKNELFELLALEHL